MWQATPFGEAAVFQDETVSRIGAARGRWRFFNRLKTSQMRRSRFGTRPAATSFVVRIKTRIKIHKGAKPGLPEAAKCGSTAGMQVIVRERLRMFKEDVKEIQAKAGQNIDVAVIRKQSSCHT